MLKDKTEYKTKLINILGGPGIGKSLISYRLISEIKLKGYSCEFVQEYAKRLVYSNDYETLSNQHQVSKEQYKMFKDINGKVDYIITDGSLLHGLYYNKYDDNNISNIEKTEKRILEYYKEFDNINIYLQRKENAVYEQNGRIQTEEESKQIDIVLKKILDDFNIPYKIFDSDVSKINEIIEFIEKF